MMREALWIALYVYFMGVVIFAVPMLLVMIGAGKLNRRDDE